MDKQKELRREIPRVLICAPTSDRHSHLIDEWIEHLENLTYTNFDVCLVDNSLKGNEYFKKLSKLKVQGRKVITWKHKWNTQDTNHLQMLAHVREDIRKYFLENDYTHLFVLDDDIFIPRNGLQTLLSYNKDQVGFYVHVFYKPNRRPCLLKSGEIELGKGLKYFTFAEIDAYKRFSKKFVKNTLSKEEKLLIPHVIKDLTNPNLFKTYGVNLGCLMIKKHVLEECQFRTHPTFIWGEDLWYFAEANAKHFDFWVDTNVRAVHKNTDWEVINQSKKQMGFIVMSGPADSKNFELINRRKNGKGLCKKK